jgi:hypothetical protein
LSTIAPDLVVDQFEGYGLYRLRKNTSGR